MINLNFQFRNYFALGFLFGKWKTHTIRKIAPGRPEQRLFNFVPLSHWRWSWCTPWSTVLLLYCTYCTVYSIYMRKEWKDHFVEFIILWTWLSNFVFSSIVCHRFRINYSANERTSSSPSGQQQMTDMDARACAQNMPQNCSFCDKAFPHIKSLKRHQRIHTEEKLYACSMCTKRFNRNSNLTQHMRTHTKPFGCSLCSKAFSEETYLAKHLESHESNINSWGNLLLTLCLQKII